MVCSQTVQCMGPQINVLKLMCVLCLKIVYRNIGPMCAKVLHGFLKPLTLSSWNEPQLIIELHPFLLHRAYDINLHSQASHLSKSV